MKIRCYKTDEEKFEITIETTEGKTLKECLFNYICEVQSLEGYLSKVMDCSREDIKKLSKEELLNFIDCCNAKCDDLGYCFNCIQNAKTGEIYYSYNWYDLSKGDL